MEELAANPDASHGLICLAEFVRRSEDFDDIRPRANELGSGKSIFPGADYSSGEALKAIAANEATPRADKAYALYRLVNCYATSGTNHCGGKNVEPPQRKAWFQTLKTKYADSTWAEERRIYW
jgi:hypothetical protein